MSDSKKINFVDDLHLKHHAPNHLASTLEKQAAAGATLPSHLTQRIAHLKSCTNLLQQALKPLLPAEMLTDCQVAHIDQQRLTISLSSATAANHLRYLSASCLQSLRNQDEQFRHLQVLDIIVSPKPTQSEHRQTSPKRTLSENTKQIITQTATTVITHERLKQALLALVNDE
ncbi:DciA family protein [Moraxella sp. Tifton1]|uniref:DciA family protein n=1 Tax=Moraxella oculi TaxID=2940516 RepID=A0ABW8UD76_9GAMM|nr:DciA family protein [Moraxella sp. Tifton1]MCL1623054.1 DciA family protein [Moraxella sp. Tifton1]